MKKILRRSKWIHRYFGLVFLLFFAWMAISGVLLNHNSLLKNFDTPRFITPDIYLPQNWNRSSLKGLVYTNKMKSDSIIIYGNQGVFIKSAKQDSIYNYMYGEYPQSARLKRTNHIVADTLYNRLLAANNDGLYTCKSNNYEWIKINLPQNEDAVNKVIITSNKIIAVGASCLYVSDYADKLDFTRIIPKRNITEEKSVSLITVFIELHDGSIWGLPGKILWDIAGLALFFLSLSAFYIWFYPKKWKRNYKKKGKRVLNSNKLRYRIFYKYHTKLGWYFAILLIIIFVTGIFLRPPFILALLNGKVSAKWYPKVINPNPWHHNIRNALYNSTNDKIVLECGDGIWAGNLFDNSAFEKQQLPFAVFAMGATVFEEQKNGNWLIGSFGGLDEYNTNTGSIKSLLPPSSGKKMGRPASILVTGHVTLPNGQHCVLGHYKGLCSLNGKVEREAFPMPDFISKNTKLPLWNFFFELHNARIFKTWIGGFYMLLIPLGGLFGLFVIISGIYDYIASRKRK